MICNTIEISNREQDFIDMLRQNVMDGIITGAHSLQDYAYLNLNKPVVAMDRNLGPDIPIIHSDHKAGGRMAARLLLDAGCRNVLNLAVPSASIRPPMTGTRNLTGLWRKMGHLSKPLKWPGI